MHELSRESLFTLEYAYYRPLLRMLKRRRRERQQYQPHDPEPKPVKLQREKFARDMAALHGGGVDHWLRMYDQGIENRRKESHA